MILGGGTARVPREPQPHCTQQEHSHTNSPTDLSLSLSLSLSPGLPDRRCSRLWTRARRFLSWPAGTLDPVKLPRPVTPLALLFQFTPSDGPPSARRVF